MLFKVQLSISALLFPMIVAWCTWVTVQVFSADSDFKEFKAAGPRYTFAQAELDHLKVKNEIMGEIAKNYPPTWLRDQVADIVNRLTIIESSLRTQKGLQ